MAKTTRKRRRVLVDKHVQGALARRIMLHWICFMSLSVTITCLLHAVANFDQMSFYESAVASFRSQIGSIVVLCAFLPWFLRDAIELSHRFAGPMVRLRHAMRGLANGEEIPPVAFRRGDFWQDVADEMNRVREVVLFGKKNNVNSQDAGEQTDTSVQPHTVDMRPASTGIPAIVSIPSISSSPVSRV